MTIARTTTGGRGHQRPGVQGPAVGRRSRSCARCIQPHASQSLSGRCSGTSRAGFEKLSSALTPHTRKFPTSCRAPATSGSGPPRAQRRSPAAGDHRARSGPPSAQASITYHSIERRTKEYFVHPYASRTEGRLRARRNAGIRRGADLRRQRIQEPSLLESGSAGRRLPGAADAAAPHSLGVHSGRPSGWKSVPGEVAGVGAREWHASVIRPPRAAACVTLRTSASIARSRADPSLVRSRVSSRPSIARRSQIEEARAQYKGR
jgi:hypothetical protein